MTWKPKGALIVVCSYKAPDEHSHCQAGEFCVLVWEGADLAVPNYWRSRSANPLATLGNIALTDAEEAPRKIEEAIALRTASLAATTATLRGPTPESVAAYKGPMVVLGRWQVPDEERNTMTVYKDGSVMWADGKGTWGKWKAIDPARGIFKIAFSTGSNFRLEISGDTAVSPSGWIYRRLPGEVESPARGWLRPVGGAMV